MTLLVKTWSSVGSRACVCVCVCVFEEGERERDTHRKRRESGAHARRAGRAALASLGLFPSNPPHAFALFSPRTRHHHNHQQQQTRQVVPQYRTHIQRACAQAKRERERETRKHAPNAPPQKTPGPNQSARARQVQDLRSTTKHPPRHPQVDLARVHARGASEGGRRGAFALSLPAPPAHPCSWARA